MGSGVYMQMHVIKRLFMIRYAGDKRRGDSSRGEPTRVVAPFLRYLFAVWAVVLLVPSQSSAATAMMFCNGNMGSASGLTTSQINGLRASGFTTLVLFTMSVSTSGDFTYNGQTICSNGVYVGPANWGSLLSQCRAAPSSVTRIEMCIGGWGDPSWTNIKNLIAAQGTNTSSVLYQNLSALKAALGIDAIDNDDESAYDSASTIQFGRMCGSVGLKFTLCPYTNSGYWQAVKAGLGEICDAVYLQCYDGGANNNPATWNNYFGGMKVIPGYWDWERDTTFLTKMQAWSAAGGTGGFYWPSCTGCNPPAGPAGMLQYATWILDTYRLLELAVAPSAGFSGVAAYNSMALPVSTVFTLSNSTTASLSWSVINTTSWLSVSSPIGTLAPGAVTTTTVGLNVGVATNLPQKVYQAGVLFSNLTSAVAVSRTFTLNTAVANWPVAVTGHNAGLIASHTATPADPGATGFDVPNGYCFYEQGLAGGTRGMPSGGAFASLCDPLTAFQLGPYGGSNALQLGYTYQKAGTLSLVSPQSFNSLVVLAASANGGGQGTLVLHFQDGSTSPIFSFNAQDWFGTLTNVALQGFGRLRLGGSFSFENPGSANPNLYQTTINLAALGLTQPVASITFSNPATAGASQNTAIFAISGMPSSVPLSAPANLAAMPGTNGAVRLEWTASAGATNYLVKRSITNGGSYAQVGSTASTVYIDSGLVNGTTYHFVVAAEGTSQSSSNSVQASAMPGSYLSWVLSSTPVAYWPMGEMTGSTAYDVIDGKTGAHSGVFTPGVSGLVGQGFIAPHRAVRYYGTTGHTVVPRLIGGTDFSVVFWVQTAASGGSPNWYNGIGLVDGEVGGTTDDFGVALVGGKVAFGVGNPDQTLLSTRSINNNVWRQVVATRQAGNGAMKIYIDGTLDAAVTGPVGPRTAPASLRIGSLQTGINYLAGSISDVAFYDRVLTPEQVAELFSAATGLFYDVTLEVRRNGGNLVLSWPGNGKLMQATNVIGPWISNNAPSPFQVAPTAPQMYFRVQTR